MLLVLLALIAFACAAILAGIQRAWAIAVGLALVTLPGLHLG
ncbi:MAG TPA: hypothetical protein VGJ95_06815 [Pseudonocardiaceae bacterium]|jgi:hypothetical protein